MIFDSPEANQRLSDTAAEAPPATFMERFQAADKQGQLRGTVLSPGFAVSEDYDRRIKDIKDAGLGDLSDLNPMWNSKPTPRAPHVYSEGHSIYDMEPSKAVEDPHEAFQKKLEQLQRDNPDKAHIIKADKPITGSESYQAAKKAAEDAAAAYGGPPLTGPIADFAGGMWSMRKDPFQVGTLVIGPMSPVRQGAKAVLTMGLKQAAANAAVEASLQPFVQSWRKSMNDSYGWWAAAEEIGMAGAFGLGADAGVRMLYRGAQARMGRKAILDEQGRVTGYESGAKAAEREALTARNLEIQKNLEALPKDTLDKVAQGDEEATIALAKALKADEDPSVGGAINALRNTDRVTLDGIDDGWRERSLIQQFRALEDPSEPAPVHFDAATKAERPRLADDAELPKGTEGNQHYRMLDIDGKPVRFEAVDANRITTDPATFQFKGGRDSAGASNALRAVDFDGRYKGKVIVYEREDGSLVVADGHDRVSLANRAPEPQKLDALIFREKDGWTAEQVRAEAARKNIQEGTGSLMDVAGAIRRHSEIVDDSMAVSTDFMADARSIARLSDEAFDAVAGGQFNPKHGVLVSDHVPDQSRHMEVLRELDRRNPPTEAAARREIGNMLREPANIETLMRVMDIPLAEPHVIEARNEVLSGVTDKLEGRSRPADVPEFADPETGFPMSAGDVESVIDMARYVQDMRKVPQPKSLYQWIIETGRLKDQGGELTTILGGKNRQLISGKGRNLDDAARSAWEAGYMQGERPTVDEFLQLVDRSVRGEKIVSLHDADMLEEIRVAREMEQELEQYGVKATASADEIRQHFTRKGGEGAGGASQTAGRAADPIRLASFARDTEELVRARAQGFDTSRTLYHGTGSVIDAFDLAKAKDKEGRQRGLGLGKDKIYLTGNQWSAGEWALNAPDRGLGDAPNVTPVYVRGRLLDEKDYHAKFAELSGGRQIFDSTLTMKERDAIIAKTDKWAKSEGYAGIQQVWRDQTGKIMETGQVAMFDPKDIRSPRAAFRGEGPALLASISYEQQAASAVIRRLSEKPGLVSDTLAQAGRAVAEGQPLERAIDATLRRFEDVIGKAGVKGLADQPVRLSPTDERPRFLATLAGSDAAVGRSMRADLDRLGYYSKALEAAKSLKQAKGTPEQMLSQLKSAGVKDAEIEATNLKQFLDGKTSVTRDDLVKHLTENRVGVNEVVADRGAPQQLAATLKSALHEARSNGTHAGPDAAISEQPSQTARNGGRSDQGSGSNGGSGGSGAEADASQGLSGPARNPGVSAEFSIPGYVGRRIDVTSNAGLKTRYYFAFPAGVEISTRLTGRAELNHIMAFNKWAARAAMVEREPGRWEISEVKVRKNQRRAGVGTYFYDQMERDMGAPLQPSGMLTDDGYQFRMNRDPESVQWHRKVGDMWLSPKQLLVWKGVVSRLAETAESLPEIRSAMKRNDEINAAISSLPDEAFARRSMDAMFALSRDRVAWSETPLEQARREHRERHGNRNVIQHDSYVARDAEHLTKDVRRFEERLWKDGRSADEIATAIKQRYGFEVDAEDIAKKHVWWRVKDDGDGHMMGTADDNALKSIVQDDEIAEYNIYSAREGSDPTAKPATPAKPNRPTPTATPRSTVGHSVLTAEQAKSALSMYRSGVMPSSIAERLAAETGKYVRVQQVIDALEREGAFKQSSSAGVNPVVWHARERDALRTAIESGKSAAETVDAIKQATGRVVSEKAVYVQSFKMREAGQLQSGRAQGSWLNEGKFQWTKEALTTLTRDDVAAMKAGDAAKLLSEMYGGELTANAVRVKRMKERKVKRSVMEEGQPLFAKPAENITPTKLNELAENLRQALDEATTPPPGRLDDPIKDAPKQVERLREDLAEDIAAVMPPKLAAAEMPKAKPENGIPSLVDLYQRYSTQGREALDAVMPGTGRMIDEFVQANPEVVARIAEALGAPTGRPQAAQMLEQAMPQFMNPRIIDMSKPVLLTPEANARMPDIRRELDRTVQMLPPEYRIRVEDSLVFNFGDGDKRLDGLHDGYEKLIYVSMAAGDPVRTSRHEVIHALRQTGLMKDEEFAALYKFADRLGLRKAYEIDAQYKEPYTQAYGNRGADFVEQLLREETVANMFSDYSLNGRRFGDVAGGGMVDRLIDMIVSFMKQVRDIMGGYGFRNVYDVFESIESGAMARRGMGDAPEASRLATMSDEPPPLARDLADVQRDRDAADLVGACRA